ncbi:AroB-related putative sugar phosphate phospholyase (cyclizing) [Draconibacterium mangrovi]|uniref:AroB-related putative sugar phosphate phospholyase (cyclizing) n=1 Tax=Draconibacterium mangrovi TaxID=2697469 RepID=UPI001954D54C|nr:AroB-related putative sugar phosphate phospholyase (cyclizing) [Draconibacterium mangrovi]
MEDIQMYNFKVKSIIHDYEVQFIENTQKVLKENLRDGDFIIIDNKIRELYSEELKDILNNYQFYGIDANEKQKSYQGVEPIINYLIKNGFRKNHRLVALGGGITQDVTAFMASIMYRGVDWLFFPTTLLAQCDSCIGSKTSINFGEYKNQVGGFYPPNNIFINPQFLTTLTDAELKSGLGEMLHYFIVSSEEDFKLYRSLYLHALTDKDALAQLINRSLEIKKGYIEVDEFDQNIRQVFNYGHSFGHAIESLTSYKVPHGIAVSFGMDMSNYISVKMGFISHEIRDEIKAVIDPINKEYSIKDLNQEQFLKALSKDKKNVGTKLGLILNKGYGNIFKNVMDADDVFKSWIAEYFEKELK